MLCRKCTPRLVRFNRVTWTAVFLCITLPFLANAAASDVSVYRDGTGWSAVLRGSIPFGGRQNLTLRTYGDVAVRGWGSAGIGFTITQRLDEPSESDARRRALTILESLIRQRGPGLEFPCGTKPIRIDLPAAITRLTIISNAGNIDVAEMKASVVIRTAGGRTSLDNITGDVDIGTGGGPTVLGLVSGNVHCVSGGGPIGARTLRGEAVLETGGGDIYVAEAFGVLRAFTGAGGIHIGHAGGPATLDTQGGPIEVGRAGGKVIARNSGGPIRVSGAPGVDCQAGSGSITLQGVSGSVVASTAHGSISVSYAGAGATPSSGRFPANSLLSTGEGDITVSIPSNVSVTLQAMSTGTAAGVQSDFPLRRSSYGPTAKAEGPINGGGPVLQIAGTSGTIWIKRQ